MPPMDMPNTWAGPIPRWSIRPTASPAICDIVYGECGLSVRPEPRLSKAITW